MAWSEVPGLARWSSKVEATSAEAPLSTKQKIARSVQSASMLDDGHIQAHLLREMLVALQVPEEHIEMLTKASGAVTEGGMVHLENFLAWVFPEQVPKPRGTGSLLEGLYAGQLTLEDTWVQASFMLQLEKLTQEHPYLEPGSTETPHPLQYWVTRCRAAFDRKKFGEAQQSLSRLLAGLRTDQRQIAEAFRRFDSDASGHLDENECKNMCAYLGWGLEEASLIDLDQDGRITLPDFTGFVGRMGGVQQLFEQRRLRISSSRKDVCDHAGLAVGSRVRAHFYCHGHKSRSWREAQVLAVGVEKRPQGSSGPVTYGVLLEFGFGYSEKQKRWRARQVVPPTWVLSSVEDASVQLALREIGLLDEDQAFWALLLPESEMRAVERLADCQRRALAGVRSHCTRSHEAKLPEVQERFQKLGFTGRELETTLGWIQDMAPICIHVNLDKMGHFMESDEFYRNQFETKTSNGALDPANNTRKSWEHELFGGAYDDAKGFDRCKYGALNVMNDYRGVVKAKQYGDSYLVLKDVRLRCTMCSTDSGGMRGNRLGVLDKYAHVLSEYNERELKGLVDVAMSATQATAGPVPELLRGTTADPLKDWITIGFPHLAQESGKWFFEVELHEECAAPQVGLLSSNFQARPGSKSSQGVGDDAYGWACDGISVSRWHGGSNLSWGQSWPAKGAQGARMLSASVVVGVAVDLEARCIFIGTDGQWDATPTFQELPLGFSLYPAMSVKGKAAFCFGPEFQFGPPTSDFLRWPSVVGKSRIDMPRIGDEEILSLYKEVQIHGEVNLKRHVQRLVAASKYREVPKTQRSYAVRVTGPTTVAGKYERQGACGDMPLYVGDGGKKIFFDRGIGKWRMAISEDDCPFMAAALPGVDEPPRSGWEAPEEYWGYLPLHIFTAAVRESKPAVVCSQGHAMKPDPRPAHMCDLCRKSSTHYRCPQSTCDYDLCEDCWQKSKEGLSAEAIDEEVLTQLVGPLQGEAQGAPVIFRRRAKTDLATEWSKLSSSRGSAEELWQTGLTLLKAEKQRLAGLSHGTVLETSHPYDAKRFSWKKEVNIDSADGLEVFFSSRTCTLDRSARFRIFSGGLRRVCAGRFARVEIAVPGLSDKVWGTVLERSEGTWVVHLDVHEAVATELEADWPCLGQELEAKSQGAWYRATVAELREDGTYLVDWFDRDSQDREKTREELRKPVERPFDHRNVDDLPRFAAFQGQPCKAVCRDAVLQKKVKFAPGTEADEQGMGRMVGDEIGEFALDLTCPLAPWTVSSLLSPGPAEAAGVELGWYLDLPGSFAAAASLVKVFDGVGGESHTNRAALIEACFKNPQEVLARLNTGVRQMRDVTLAFTNSCSPSQVTLLPEALVQFPADVPPASEILQVDAHLEGGGLPDQVKVGCHGCELKKFDNGSTTWFCDHPAPGCSRSSEGPKVRWSCRNCGYDLCRACVEHHLVGAAPKKGFSLPVKSLAKKGLVGSAGVRAGWRVDLRKTLYLNPSLKSLVPKDYDVLNRFLQEGHQEDEQKLPKVPKKKSKKAKKKEKRMAAKLAEAEAAAAPSEPEPPKEAEPPKEESDGLSELSFTVSLEEVMSGPAGMMEAISMKMSTFMAELGWSDPMEFALLHPVTVDPKVTSVSGVLIEAGDPTLMATTMAAMTAPGSDPFGPGGELEGHESPFPLTFTLRLPRKEGAAPAVAEPEKLADEEVEPEEEAPEPGVVGEEENEGDQEAAEVKELPQAVTLEEAKASLHSLLEVPGLCIAFAHLTPQASLVHEGFGPKTSSCWGHCQVPGDYAQFEFVTDGDPGDKADQRWGVLALVLPTPVEAEQREQVEGFLEDWADSMVRASGTAQQPQVERDGWDEARLRALCARHGWEFEWMTEDGERQRRAQEQWDVLKLSTPALPSDPAAPDGSR